MTSRALTGSIVSSTQPLRIGGNQVWGEYFAGLIDDVRVYNRALSAAQIQTDMNTPVSVADTGPPVISSVSTSVGGSSTATVQWATDEPSTSVVRYGTSPASLTLTVSDPLLLTAHGVQLAGLTAGTTYYYQVTSVDAAGNSASSAVGSFATTADTPPPILTVTKAGTGSGAVTSSPAGISCGADCSEPYSSGTVVSLSAAAATGSNFSGWTGACTGTGACSVTMTADSTVGATFTIQRNTLTVTTPTRGTISGAGIACGTGGSDCSEAYDYGTVVPLTATPDSGYTFGGWTGDCTGTGACTVTMTAARSVAASFTPASVSYTLTVNKAGTGSGAVTSSPAGISCGADCSEPYSSGTVVSLSAAAATGSNFSGWTGDCTGTGACTVTMTAARTVGATFTIQRNTLTATAPSHGTISGTGIACGTGGSDCSEAYDSGTVVPLTATPDSGYTFGGWTGDCTGTGACTVTMTAARTVGATFTIQRNTLTATLPTHGTISGTGIACGTGGSDCTEAYDYGTVVPLTATPDSGYNFGGWTGDCTGTGACTVTMTAASAVGATFTIQRNTLTATLPTHGTITGTGIACGTGGSDCTEAYDYGTAVPLTATPDSGYNFGGWTGDCTGTGACTVTMTAASAVGATFTIQRNTLTATLPTHGTITGTGIACGTGGSDCTEAYDYGTAVPLTATPDSGYTFSGWTGDCTGTGACTVTMTAARSVAASFTPASVSYTLTVTKAGTGSGAVTSSPAGISCGADCSEPYSSGTVVTLSAAAATGSNFSGWTGDCTGTGACTVTMTAARTVGATFTIQRNTLTATTPTHGTISGTGIACGTGGSDCSEAYDYGTAVPLTATPDSGYNFGGWTGDCTGTGACTVTMTAARTVGATFTIQRNTLTATLPTHGTITGTGIACGTGGSDCSEAYDYGTAVPLTATPDSGYTFSGWTGDCTGTGACTVTMTAARSVAASFTPASVSYTLTVTKAGTGSGAVTSSPAGISCGADCSEPYSSGTVVTLSAAAATGSNFSGWTGDCTGTGACTVTMTAARTVGATFALLRYTLTVRSPNHGRITATGITCGTGGADCAETFNYGTVVPLTAIPDPGYRLTSWTGACSGTGPCSVTLDANKTVGGRFR